MQDYLPHRVPEVWLYQSQQMLIYRLEDAAYQLQSHSRYFPNFDVQSAIVRTMQIACDRNTSVAIRDLKQQIHH